MLEKYKLDYYLHHQRGGTLLTYVATRPIKYISLLKKPIKLFLSCIIEDPIETIMFIAFLTSILGLLIGICHTLVAILSV